MTKQFQDKTVLITGASSGFGAAFAHAFAKEGAQLVILARRKERLEELASELKTKYNTDTHLICVDIANTKEVIKQLNELPEKFATPDILINNAGLVRGLHNIWETSPDQWNEVIDINVKGILTTCFQVIPRMLKRNSGHIINIGSISGHDSYPGGGVYCATKYAVTALTDTLRKELVATPLRVSMISPGMAQTEFSKVRYKDDEKRAAKVYENFEALQADDIAEIVLFMASRPPHVNIADVIVYPTHQASVSILHRSS
ncbi:MAG: SDR family NAD(P)-dependent oxidoreductase [Parachlamydiaceae bacterium]|nr:SDR family NAD(P)-dependent oxidoreductase [Parachlamydiaceae bacterium]